MPQYASVLELSALDGNNGFKINGLANLDDLGFCVSSAGDLDGDGIADLVVGAYGVDGGGTDKGAAYVIFGSTSSFGAEVTVSSLDGTDGYRFLASSSITAAGRGVSSAGDVNGDGIDDLIVGAPFADPNGGNSGIAYVVFGGALNLDSLDDLDGTDDGTILLGNIDGDNGFMINGEGAADFIGDHVASAGDINHDGYSDIIVSTTADDEGGTGAGAAYVVYGSGSGFSAEVELGSLDGNDGFKILGADTTDGAGSSSASAGDVNNDGFDDLIVGAFAENAAYVVFGKASSFGATLDLSSLDGDNGFKLAGEAASYAGDSVASAGDINADGFADVIVGAHRADPGGSDSGASYVVFGKASGFDAEIDILALDGTDGFRIDGEAAGDRAGWSVSSAGDFNGDGFNDLIVGARVADPNGTSSGASYIVFGKASGFSADIDLSSLDGNNGFQLNGEAADDFSGGSVSAAGDINDDGFADVIVGAHSAYGAVANSGAAYVIFGGKPSGSVTRTGTSIDNIIHGGDSADTLSGSGGNDTLFGHNGGDTLDGGSDKDTLEGGSGGDTLYGGSNKDTLSGGNQSDTLDGGGSADDIEGGGGADIFVYGSASNSTSSSYDTVIGADFASADTFNLAITVAAIDATVTSGQLRKSNFDTDLAAAVGSGQLGALHAVLFTPTSGNLSGKTFLVVDLNGSAGYQASADLVLELSSSVNLGSLNTADFV